MSQRYFKSMTDVELHNARANTLLDVADPTLPDLARNSAFTALLMFDREIQERLIELAKVIR